jgi:hypothetical protein
MGEHGRTAIIAKTPSALLVLMQFDDGCSCSSRVAKGHDDAGVVTFEHVNDERQRSSNHGDTHGEILKHFGRMRVSVVSLVVQQ